MATLTHKFPESTSSTQTQKLTISKLKQVKSVTVDKGTVTYSVDGEEITFNLKGRPYDRRVQTGGSSPVSKTASTTSSDTGNSFGSCSDAQSLGAGKLPQNVSYNSGGYSGTLYRQSTSYGSCTWDPEITYGRIYSVTATGHYSGTVWTADTRTYAYYYSYTVTVEYIDNANPTVSLTNPIDNQILTEGNELRIEGSASDSDNSNVITTKYKINNGTTRALASGISDGTSPLSFAKTFTYKNKRLHDGSVDITGTDLPENTDHTITIWAEDDQGGKSPETIRTFRVIHNRPPLVSGQNSNLGAINTVPTITYSVTDPEQNAFTITEKINNQTIRSFAGVASQEYTATIPQEKWIRLSLTDVHKLTIEATDSQGLTSVRSYTFTRTADKISYQLKNPFQTDIAAKRILITIDADIPAGATYKVEVTNNGQDAEPFWEDATNNVKFNRGYMFTNTTKTAEQWAVNVRMLFEKNSAGSPVIVRGFGGAFD
ncbi:Ig-like domain-containing protein [Brevibacillus daliensis]|uniref:Ig-like domain-containing protein n=1 Tax=Brevibacillus daliensis TaxID=2892995 RepID=UPI001E5D0AB6|nr:Ig-like domain-containing protein [Brevibacillus daliensis]